MHASAKIQVNTQVHLVLDEDEAKLLAHVFAYSGGEFGRQMGRGSYTLAELCFFFEDMRSVLAHHVKKLETLREAVGEVL